MRFLRYSFYMIAVSSFVVLQSSYIATQKQRASLSTYSRAIADFLGLRSERGRFLLILSQGKPVGFSSLRVRRTSREGIARFQVELDASVHVVPALKERGDVDLALAVTLSQTGLIEEARGGLIAFGKALYLSGKRERGRLRLTVKAQGGEVLRSLAVPAELAFGGPVFPLPPLGGLKLGEVRRIPYFDPLLQQQAVSTVEVRERLPVQVAGLHMEGFLLKVKNPAGRFEVITSPEGEIIKVKGPLGISLTRSTEVRVRLRFGGVFQKHRALKRGLNPERKTPGEGQ